MELMVISCASEPTNLHLITADQTFHLGTVI
jgi:hypothetical protein